MYKYSVLCYNKSLFKLTYAASFKINFTKKNYKNQEAQQKKSRLKLW
jgi:hypothetical protein